MHQGLKVLDVFPLIALRIFEYKVHPGSILEE